MSNLPACFAFAILEIYFSIFMLPSLLMIIAPEKFKDPEYYTPRAVFEKAGFHIDTASTVHEAISSDTGQIQKTDLLLDAVHVSKYDAVVFVGGSGAAVYFDLPIAHQIAHAFYDAKKVVSAICAGPSILAHAGLLKGKNATCYPSRAEDLQSHGAFLQDAPVVIDEKIITANGPLAAQEFGETIVRVLLEA